MPNPAERYQSCEELMYDLENYEKLDDQFRVDCFRKMRSFLISAGLTVAFGIFALIGYIGLENEKNQNYENLMKEGYSYTVKGEYEDAVEIYIDAITEVDGSRETAYIELIDLYINYMDNPREGLSRVTYYIDQKHQNIHKNQELLFDVAMNYFDVLKDYKASARYFNMMDKRKYPEMEYYSTISLAMGELNVDYKELMNNLYQFEKINDNQTISINKLKNYELLCIVYSRNLKQMDGAAEKLIEVGNKALTVLDSYEDDSVKAEYYAIYNQYLALAYQSMGNQLYKEDINASREYYEKSIECCDFILGMVSDEDEETIDSITDSKLREAKYAQKAEIYEALGEYDKAIKVYEKAEKEYKNSSIILYTGHLSLLCKIQEKTTTDVEQWDYEILHTFYEEGCKVPNIKDDYRWKQLTQKLTPLFEKNGGR